MGKKVEAYYKETMKVNMPSAVQADVKIFSGQLDLAKKMLEPGLSLAWSMHQANTMNVKIMVIEDAIKDTSGRLVLAYEQAKEERRVQVSQKKASEKTTEAADKRQLAAYTNASAKTPFNLAKYLRDNKAIEVPAQTVMVNMDKIEADEDALPCDRLSYIPAGPFGVAGRLGKLVDSLDNQRFARTWNRLQEAVMHKEANGLCMQRLPPRGHPFDTLEKLEWLPTEWNVAKLIPQKLADFGTPILMANKYACTRMGFGDMPMIGIGQFIVNAGGEFVLCAWPGRSLVDRGPIGSTARASCSIWTISCSRSGPMST